MKQIFASLFLLLFAVPLAARQQNAAQAPARPATAIVTASSPKGGVPPAVSKQDIVVRQDKDRRPVLDWVRAQGEHAGLDLAILIDDAADPSLGLQFPDLTVFLRGLPATTKVAVAYASYGSAKVLQDFTADHEQATRALRVTVGEPGASPSIYLSLISLLKDWPEDGNRHEVLVISDGIDLMEGVDQSSPLQNLNVQQAIDQAQRRGVVAYTLLMTSRGRIRRNFYLLGNGMGSLARLGLDTGGDAFAQGFEPPVSFKPFLQQLAGFLEHQYLLTFQARPAKGADFSSLKVTTELSGVELSAPARVYAPAK